MSATTTAGDDADDATGDAPGGPGTTNPAAGFIGGFAPWIVYWVLTGNTSYATAISIAFALAVLSNVVTLVRGGRHRLKALELGNVAAFVALAAVGLAAGDAFVERWIQPLGNGALLAVMVGSVAVGRPFTLQYAEEATDPALWDTPGFRAVNTVLTWVWIGAMTVMTTSALVPPVLQGEATMRDGGTTLSIVCYWVVPFTTLGLAFLATARYPDWFGAEFDDPEVRSGHTRSPLPTTRVNDVPRADGVALDVEPSPALLDEPVVVTISGAPPGADVGLLATTVDAAGNLWRSSARFRADGHGSTDSSRDAPVTGDYQGVDAGGPLWSMRFATEDATPDIYLPPTDPAGVALTASVAGRTLTRTLVRRPLAPGVAVRDVDEDGVVGRLLTPAGDGHRPGVVLLGGSEGGVDSQMSNGAVLASRGYAVLLLGYFGLDGLPDALARIPLERLAAGARWLAARPEVDPGAVAAMGTSRGAEGLLSMTARVPDHGLAALVAVSPASVSWTAVGDDGTMPGVPSWTLGGDPVPHLDMADRVLMDEALVGAVRHRGHHDPLHPRAMVLAHAYAAALGDGASDDGAAIPVERIAAPLLCLSGSDDQVWPSGAMADAVLARRRAAGRGDGDHHQHYAGAGHLIRLGCLPTDVAATGGIALGGTRPGIAAAQADATARVLAFLHTYLRP